MHKDEEARHIWTRAGNKGARDLFATVYYVGPAQSFFACPIGHYSYTKLDEDMKFAKIETSYQRAILMVA